MQRERHNEERAHESDEPWFPVAPQTAMSLGMMKGYSWYGDYGVVKAFTCAQARYMRVIGVQSKVARSVRVRSAAMAEVHLVLGLIN